MIGTAFPGVDLFELLEDLPKPQRDSPEEDRSTPSTEAERARGTRPGGDGVRWGFKHRFRRAISTSSTSSGDVDRKNAPSDSPGGRFSISFTTCSLR